MKISENADCRLTVMTLNLRFGRADDGPDQWENRKDRYASFFQEYRPDIIGMQEANDFQVEFFTQVLEGYNCIGQMIPSPPYWQDNLIYFKKEWVCCGFERFFFSHTPAIPSRFQESKWPRQCVIGIFRKKEKSVVCVNTHFDFLSSVQEQSAKMIVQKLSAYSDPQVPIILTGDFNALPGSPGYRELVTHGRMKEIFHGEYSGTYHGFTGKKNDRHIDWILYRGPVELINRKMILEPFQGGYPSDHFPVLAEFRISTHN